MHRASATKAENKNEMEKTKQQKRFDAIRFAVTVGRNLRHIHRYILWMALQIVTRNDGSILRST